jgi:hypothetical protein
LILLPPLGGGGKYDRKVTWGKNMKKRKNEKKGKERKERKEGKKGRKFEETVTFLACEYWTS